MGLYPECVFYVPICRDSDRALHAPVLWKMLQDALLAEFGGSYSGPETVRRVFESDGTVPGTWTPTPGETPVCDQNRKYAIALAEEDVGRLRAFLGKVGRTFDQRSIYLVVAGYSELVDIVAEGELL